MQIINGTTLSQMVDYSFGDHLGGLDPDNLIGGHSKFANESNTEFLDKCKEFEGKVMTLFIDNIRLYNRVLFTKSEIDSHWVAWLLNTNDLLALCRKLPNNKFVIFTSHEDTPIDEYISVPNNVEIHAVNAVYNNDRIHPFPIGLQRQIGLSDNRLSVMKEVVEKDESVFPTKLLYINCGLGSERNEEERAYLPHFQRYDWATCRFEDNSKFYPYSEYRKFLSEIQDHKFMVCPKGHGMDCHRNWESLYLRRVPIFKDHPYFRMLMKGFPVLFVDEWSDITPKLLIDNDHLFQEAQKMTLKKLDLRVIFDIIMKRYEM
jgi:hypothetical protein